MTELTELEIIKAQLKAANITLIGLRARNKELHEELKENIKNKREYYKNIIPTLRKQKQNAKVKP
jgi:hypothetical protein